MSDTLAAMEFTAKAIKEMVIEECAQVADEHSSPQFGHDDPVAVKFWHLGEAGKGEVKATCFWLDGLDPLEPTTPDEIGRHPACWLQPPSEDRWKDRSRTYPGIADAMGEQFSRQLEQRMAA